MTARRPGVMLLAACLAALALRLVVPAGWMPVAAPGGMVISLCSGASLPGDPARPADAGDQPCGFALSLGPMLLAAAVVLPLLALPLLPVSVPVPPAPALLRRRPRPPGQGPPAA